MINRATKLTYYLFRPYLTRLRDRMALAMGDKTLLRIFRDCDEEMRYFIENKKQSTREYIIHAPIECIVYKYRKDYYQIIQKAIDLGVLSKIAHRFRKGFCCPVSLYGFFHNLIYRPKRQVDLDIAYDLFTNAYGWVFPPYFRAFVPMCDLLLGIFRWIGPNEELDRFLAALGKRRWKRVEQIQFSSDDFFLGRYIRNFNKNE